MRKFASRIGLSLLGLTLVSSANAATTVTGQITASLGQTNAGDGIRQSVEADWQGTLRGRLGLAQEQWLAYLTAGIAVTRLKLDSQYSDTFLDDGRGQGSSEETKTGWVVGAGGEYALSERLSLRGEYLYADYGSVDTSYAVTNPGNPSLSSTIRDKVDFKTQTVTLGLAYRF